MTERTLFSCGLGFVGHFCLAGPFLEVLRAAHGLFRATCFAVSIFRLALVEALHYESHSIGKSRLHGFVTHHCSSADRIGRNGRERPCLRQLCSSTCFEGGIAQVVRRKLRLCCSQQVSSKGLQVGCAGTCTSAENVGTQHTPLIVQGGRGEIETCENMAGSSAYVLALHCKASSKMRFIIRSRART